MKIILSFLDGACSWRRIDETHISSIMTEIRTTSSSNKGLFATRDYAVGDVIVATEAPLAVLAPRDETQETKLIGWLQRDNHINKSNKKKLRLWDVIQVPRSVGAVNIGKFKGMVQAALCFLDADPSESLPLLLDKDQAARFGVMMEVKSLYCLIQQLN